MVMPTASCAICESPLKAEIEKKDAVWKADRTIQWARSKGLSISRVSLARHRRDHLSKSNVSEKRVKNAPVYTPRAKADEVSDHHFLDTVKQQVYEKLVGGELELKLDFGFKAIELKNKISEGSQNEKLLLEILSELRSEVLGCRRETSTESL